MTRCSIPCYLDPTARLALAANIQTAGIFLLRVLDIPTQTRADYLTL
jgi:hypothetical protein